jgi:hypothetical protein
VATPNEIRRIEIAASRVAAQLLGGLLGLPAAWFLFSTPGVPSFEAQVNPAKAHNAGVEGSSPSLSTNILRIIPMGWTLLLI